MLNRIIITVSAFALTALPAAARAAEGPKQIESQTNIGTLQEVPEKLLVVLIGLLPFVATLYLVLSGYRYMIAQGNPELIDKAKKSLLYAVWGVIIAYSSVALILTVAKALGYNPRFG